MKIFETTERDASSAIRMGLLLALLTLPWPLLTAPAGADSPPPELGDCSAVGIGVLGGPESRALREYQGDLYDGGRGHLVRRQGGVWTSFAGTPVPGPGGWEVREMALHQGKLAAGGSGIVGMGAVTVNNIMTWDGSVIEALGAGFDDQVSALVSWGGNLVAGGTFVSTSDGALTVNGIALWDGAAWQALDGGMSGTGGEGPVVHVHDLAVFQGDLWVAGLFEFAGNELVNGLARWDGTAWHSVGGLTSSGGATTGLATALAEYQGRLYVSGYFSDVAGTGIANMAAWDGSSWHPGGFDGEELGPIGGAGDMVFTGDRLVAVGFEVFFLGAGIFYDMAYWDGVQWHGVGPGGASGLFAVAASTTDPSRWYFGGDFFNIIEDRPDVYEMDCSPLDIPIFSDGFETGDPSAWSLTVP